MAPAVACCKASSIPGPEFPYATDTVKKKYRNGFCAPYYNPSPPVIAAMEEECSTLEASYIKHPPNLSTFVIQGKIYKTSLNFT